MCDIQGRKENMNQKSFPKTHPKLGRYIQLVEVIESGNYSKEEESEYRKLLNYLNSMLYQTPELMCPSCHSEELVIDKNMIECQSCGWMNE